MSEHLSDSGRGRVAHPPKTPLLVFDGDCTFCRHWILRWQAMTGGDVIYAPFQEVAGEYPEIPKEAFQEAVQLITPEGSVFGGAEAVFRTFAHVPGRRWLFWCFEKIPGVAPFTEWCYRVVAGRRVFFSHLTHFLWGRSTGVPSYFLTRSLFLRFLGVIGLIAFVSLWTQIEGLVGSNGILPAKSYLGQMGPYLGAERYWMLPTLFWFNASDLSLHLVCGGGVFLSLLLIFGILPAPVLLLLWALYLSLLTVCQDFLSFQWDILLLETTFLAIFLSPLTFSLRSSRASPPSSLVLWLSRWLLFRLYFSSGMVKLASGDPTWRNLTALRYHYETQPLPTWLGWVVHQLPLGFQKMSTAAMFGTELVIPFLIFAPRRIRYAGCAVMIGLQLLIAATGNYNFFNLLTIALCLLLLEDSFWPSWLRKKGAAQGSPPGEPRRIFRRWPKWILLPVAFVILLMTTVQVAGLFRRRHWPLPVMAITRAFLPFHSVNSYGLFAVMTTERPEIIVEGSNDGVTWLAYEFKYKPGDVKRKPPFVAPHQPRLDWQMWFAALGPYQESPWFLSFCVRLLHGSPEVLALLKKNPFPESPPRYIRALLYDYRFTDLATLRKEGRWWERRELSPYCPVLSLKSRRP